MSIVEIGRTDFPFSGSSDAAKAVVAAAPVLTDAERAAAIRAKVAELMEPLLAYINGQHALGFQVGFDCAGAPGGMRLERVNIAKVL